MRIQILVPAMLFLALCCALATGLAPSCLQPRYQLQTSNVAGGAELVLERVERYAAARPELSKPVLDQVAADVEAVRAQLKLPTADARTLAPPLLRVCDEHDTWVSADTTLLPLERTTYLGTTERLRALVRPPG